MEILPSDVNVMCPTCKYGVGQPFSVAVNCDYKIIHLRYPGCGRDWRVRNI